MTAHDEHALSAALAELADTMPDDPYRLDAIHARVGRQRTVQRVRRATIGVALAGVTVVAVAALRPTVPSVSTVPAASSTAAPTQPSPTHPSSTAAASTASLPACAAVPPTTARSAAATAAERAKLAAAAQAAKAAAAGSPGAAGSSTPADAAAKERAARGQLADLGPAQPGIKAFGTILRLTTSSIAIKIDVPAQGGPGQVTASFTNKTAYLDGETQVTRLPSAKVGDKVAFAAVSTGHGSYDLLLLQIHPTTPNPGAKPGAATQVTDAKKAAQAAAGADSAHVKGLAEIVSVQSGSLTLKFSDGQLVGKTVTAAVTPHVVYSVGDQQCVNPALARGEIVGVALLRGAGNAYTLEKLALHVA
jgi:hypothetical protein